MTTRPDTRPDPPPPVHDPAPASNAAAPTEQDRFGRLTVEYDRRIAADLHGVLIHQMMTVSLDLHAALSLTADGLTADRIRQAINGLDQAINDLRTSIFELGRSGP